jgi:hypothetical protein
MAELKTLGEQARILAEKMSESLLAPEEAKLAALSIDAPADLVDAFRSHWQALEKSFKLQRPESSG